MKTSALAPALLALAHHAPAATTIFPGVLTNGPVTIETTSSDGTFLDEPKLSVSANETSYDWWYFDAVSASTNASVSIIFFNSGPQGFALQYTGSPVSALVSGNFANGTSFSMGPIPASSAMVQYNDNSISGQWADTGFSFAGNGLGPGGMYVVQINSPEIGVQGTFSLRSRAPAHYPCGPDEAGQTQLLMPHIGWANAVPDGDATVDLIFTTGSDAPTTVQFTDGIGYHDKNWGDQTFTKTTEQWYWGHARLGPYSLVWFDALDWAGKEYFSGYVVADGEVLNTNACAANAVVVRPWGANDTYPPTASTGLLQGLEIVWDMDGSGDGGQQLVANVTVNGLAALTPGYARTLGSVTGGLVGGEMYTGGRALFEQFAFIGANSA